MFIPVPISTRSIDSRYFSISIILINFGLFTGKLEIFVSKNIMGSQNDVPLIVIVLSTYLFILKSLLYLSSTSYIILGN